MRTFYTLVLTQTLSLIGSQISGLAIGIYIYQTTGDATPLALVAFFAMLPQAVMSSFAGVMADRYDRRLLMALSDLGQGVTTVFLLLSFMSGGFQLWHLYAATLVRQILGVFQSPAFGATITMLVPNEQRDRANAIAQVNSPLAGIIAPAIAGLIYAASGVNGAIMVDLVTCAVAVVVVLSLNIPRPVRTEAGEKLSGSTRKELIAGFRYLWDRKILFWLALYATLLNFLLTGAGALMTPFLLARTHNEAVMGVLSSLTNAGMLVGAVLMGIIGGRKTGRMHIVMPGIAVAGVGLMLFGVVQATIPLAVVCFLMLMPMPAVNAAFMSILQAKVAPDVQGRVFATINQLAILLTPLSALLIGPLTDNVFEPAVKTAFWQNNLAGIFGGEAGAGMGLIFALAGAGVALVSLVVYAMPSARNAELKLPDYEPVASEDTANMVAA